MKVDASVSRAPPLADLEGGEGGGGNYMGTREARARQRGVGVGTKCEGG